MGQGPAASASALLDQIVLEDRHLELKRAVVVFIVDKQDADEFLANIDLGRIVLLRPWHHANFGIAEQALEIGVEFPDFLNVHGDLQYDFRFREVLGRAEANRRSYSQKSSTQFKGANN